MANDKVKEKKERRRSETTPETTPPKTVQDTKEANSKSTNEPSPGMFSHRTNMIFHSLFIFLLSFLIISYPNWVNPFSNVQNVAAIINDPINEKETANYPKPVEMNIPSVSIGIIVRNKGHSLPYFLGQLERQTYPKERVEILFYIDDSIDDSYQIVEEWVNTKYRAYHFANFYHDDSLNATQFEEYWTRDHFDHVMQLRQKILDSSRNSWADYHLSIDADIMLTEPTALYDLVMASETSTYDNPISIISPLLDCTNTPSYANFWGSMSDEGYYIRSSDYFEIRQRKKQGIFKVPMVHSAILINLRHLQTQNVGYWPLPEDYSGPRDDIIVFAKSAQFHGVQMYIDNRKKYGYFSAPVEAAEANNINLESSLARRMARDVELFVHLKLQVMLDTENTFRLEYSEGMEHFVEKHLPEKSLLNFDKIYVINLKRRQDRLDRMIYCLNELGISWEYFEAVDGKQLTSEEINNYGIKQLPGYYDPYHKRSLKFGEIGCFLSHYKIWQEIVEKNLTRVLIFEDDIRFMPGFKRMANEVMSEINEKIPNWDLLYFGRKRMSNDERRVNGSKTLAYPDYTYWTLAYCITYDGAKKLLNQKPLGKIIAVDEYIPIMFDRHPNKEWLTNFEPRDLLALSAEPLLVEPTHYTGEPNYFSDTENSTLIEAQ